MLRLVALLIACAIGAAGANEKLTCASCHAKEAASHGATGMAHALESAQRADVLKSHPALTFEQGTYKYRIDRKGSQSVYQVSDGKDEIRVPVAWAFGLGTAGQTYLFERNGKWHESRVSYYRDTKALDLTVGARPDTPRSLEEAVGRELSTKGANECFNCHATGAVTRGILHTDSLTPGIQCQRCHEKSEEHFAAFQRPDASKIVPRRLGTLAAEEMSEFCGQCHRTWSDIATNGPHNVANVRFQPYRLTNSKCYDTADMHIRCTACHDPHSETEHPASFYDARCGACHSPSGKPGARLCKVAKSDCVTCHMPKIEIREAHNKFTDHWIRVVRPRDPYPED